MRYTVLIDGEAGAYGVHFPDLPGCTAMGASVEAALDDAAEAVRDWVRGVESRGRTAPSPRPVEALRADPDVARELAAGATLASVVLIREAGRPVKANLSLDAGVLEAIDAAAERLGMTRSALVEVMAARALPTLG